MKNFFLNNILERTLILFIFLFSLLINQYYGNRGVFPIDSFSHFDTGFRILLDEHPFKDYWIISGPIIDYFQAIFFYIFGVNWQSYILHASVMNSVLALSTFFLLKNFKLNIYLCFTYSISLSILAYPSSGTPFTDHHAAFFSLLGVYVLILGIKSENKFYWTLLPFLFVFAFFSKQVPSSYVIIYTIFILLTYSLVKKKFYWIKYSLLSSALIIFFIICFFLYKDINFDYFLNQYIFYPQTLGDERYKSIDVNFDNLITRFKFIYLAMIVFAYINLKRFYLDPNFLKNNNFYYFVIILFLTFSLILHQLLTMNQTFIFFLIPILIAFSNISIIGGKKYYKILTTLMILLCLFTTAKYHIRFNENRKFHELHNTNFNLALSANTIDKKLSGLLWITPKFKNNPKEEISLIMNIKSKLKNDNRKKMFLTNYSFFSVILNQNLFSPMRWYIENGISHPKLENKYFKDFQEFFIKKIKENKIEVIYTAKPADVSFLKDMLGEKCIKTSNVDIILDAHLLINCDKLK